jgi:uncharacterized protein YbjT (DUF2867 family)
MRVLLTGAAGLIGSAVAARLHAAGHEIVAVMHSSSAVAEALVVDRRVTLDMARATRPEDWRPLLQRVDVVVNCAGVLQDSPRDSTAGVHLHGTSALFRACVDAKVKRIIHVSAIGADQDAPTAFSQTKHAADAALMSLDIDWIILHPSIVLGRGAHGGSALLRGLAALPVLPVVPDTQPLQVVHLDDLVATIMFFLNPAAPARQALQIVGPERYSLTDLVQLFRRWLGWRPVGSVRMPPWLATSLFRLGDAVSLLGWRPPVRSTVQSEIARGSVGDPSQWTRLTGIKPRALPAALAAEPASVQERWFARLYLLKPLVFGVLVLFWIATGLVTLGPGWEIGKALMQEGGVREPLASFTMIAGSLADIVIGIGIAFRRTARLALHAAVALSLAYAIIGTVLLPRLWADPVGPMWKICPIIVLLMVALAIREER